jgi:hypothetical protein
LAVKDVLSRKLLRRVKELKLKFIVIKVKLIISYKLEELYPISRMLYVLSLKSWRSLSMEGL